MRGFESILAKETFIARLTATVLTATVEERGL